MIFPTTPLIHNEQVLDFIPQRPPMVMVDAFYGSIEDATYSSLLIQPNNIFSQDGFFSEVGVIEFMAQAGIVQFGYLNRASGETTQPSMGFICKLKKFEIFQLPPIGDCLFAKVEKDFATDNLATLFITAYTHDAVVMKGFFDVITIQ